MVPGRAPVQASRQTPPKLELEIGAGMEVAERSCAVRLEVAYRPAP